MTRDLVIFSLRCSFSSFGIKKWCDDMTNGVVGLHTFVVRSATEPKSTQRESARQFMTSLWDHICRVGYVATHACQRALRFSAATWRLRRKRKPYHPIDKLAVRQVAISCQYSGASHSKWPDSESGPDWGKTFFLRKSDRKRGCVLSAHAYYARVFMACRLVFHLSYRTTSRVKRC